MRSDWRIWLATWSTMPPGALRSTGTPPHLRRIQPTGPQNASFLPMKTMPRLIPTFAAMPQIASQAEECGATMTTTRSTSGHCPTIRQPPSRSTVRPMPRVKALPPLCGACGPLRNDRPHSRSQPRAPRVLFTCERSRLPVRRRSFEARVGRVGTRLVGTFKAAWTNAARRSRASSRLRSWSGTAAH